MSANNLLHIVGNSNHACVNNQRPALLAIEPHIPCLPIMLRSMGWHFEPLPSAGEPIDERQQHDKS